MAAVSVDQSACSEVSRLKCGSPGFDEILGGGIRIGQGRSPSVILMGPAGAGKTTTATQFSINTFESGKSVAYFSLELSAEEIRDAVAQFSLAPRDWHDRVILDRDSDGDNEFKMPSTGEPAFVVSQFAFSVKQALEEIEPDSDAEFEINTGLIDHVKMVVQQIPDCGLIVIDSLSGLFGNLTVDKSSFSMHRALFHELCRVGDEFNAPVIVLLEQEEAPAWRNFVADVVIKLGWQTSAGNEWQRYVQVVKARFQSIYDGRHEFRIDSQKGVVVFPNLTEVLRNVAAKPSAMDTGESNQASGLLANGDAESKIFNWSKSFSANKEFNRMLDGGEGYVARASTTLLYGPDNTRKKAVVASFLLQGVLPSPENEEKGKVLFLVAGHTVCVARRILRKYLDHELLKAHFFDVDQIVIVPVSGFFESVNELAYEISQLHKQHRFSRMAFDDLAAFFGEPTEMLPIAHFCSLNGITSLFVHTTDPGIESPVREHFDTFIRSRHLIFPNKVNSCIGYQALRLNGCTQSTRDRSWELLFEDGNGDAGQLRVRDSFREFVEDKAGQLHRLPVGLFLHGDFESTQTFWKSETTAIFGERRADKPNFPSLEIPVLETTDAHIDLSRYLALATHNDMAGTWVGNVDQPWLDHLVAQDKLLPLNDLFEHDLPATFHPQAWSRGTVKGKQYGIPHRVDCGIYTMRTDIVTHEILDSCGFARDKTDWTWEEMNQAALLGLEHYDPDSERSLVTRKTLEQSQYYMDENFANDLSSEKPKPFGFFNNLTCFFLEVLWPFLFENGEFTGFESNDPQSAMIDIYQHLKSMGALDFADHDSRQPCVFERNWFGTYWESARRFPRLAESSRIINAPFLNERPAASISGEWYLSIFKGSPNPGRGMWAIRSLTDEPANRRLFQQKVGLPANARLWETANCRKYSEHYRHSVTRREIPDYYKIQPVLLDHVKQIFTSASHDEDALKGIWREMLDRMKPQKEEA